MSATEKDLVSRVKAELGRDKKKTVILLALVVVGGAVAGRALVRGLPRSAAAAGPAATPPAEGAPEVAAPQPAPLPSRFAGVGEYLAQLDRTVTRDIFHVSPELYPPEAGGRSVRVLPASRPAEPGWMGQLDEWMAQRQAAQQAQQQRADLVRAQAQALVLESTMLGTSPTALINGQVLRKGEWVNGFRVERIDSKSCVVSRDGVEVELSMRQ